MRQRDAVLLVSHGSVDDLDELPEFLARIRRGRPVSSALLAETRRRYELIGGSPLNDTTRRQAEALSARLGSAVYAANRLSSPTISDTLELASEAGVQRLCVLPLAPFSVHVYAAAVAEAARALSESGTVVPELVHVPAYGSSPGLVRAHADLIRPALKAAPEARLLLTLHSLPTAVVRGGDPYEALAQDAATQVGNELGAPYDLAYQSAGADGGDWLGPDLRDVLRGMASAGEQAVVVAPFGFLSDHVETLYDLDVEAAALARELGLGFQRVPAQNDGPLLVQALAEVVEQALATAN